MCSQGILGAVIFLEDRRYLARYWRLVTIHICTRLLNAMRSHTILRANIMGRMRDLETRTESPALEAGIGERPLCLRSTLHEISFVIIILRP
jgi:hypothetical protein